MERREEHVILEEQVPWQERKSSYARFNVVQLAYRWQILVGFVTQSDVLLLSL